MEIILAFLVFFGGFTLGSISIEKEGDSSQSTSIINNGSGVADTYQTPQTIYLNEPNTCHLAPSSNYRDLTHPYHGHSEQQAIESGDCEAGSPDE